MDVAAYRRLDGSYGGVIEVPPKVSTLGVELAASFKAQ